MTFVEMVIEIVDARLDAARMDEVARLFEEGRTV